MINIIVCGSRTFTNYSTLCAALDDFLQQFPNEQICIVSGCARGADALAIQYAEERNLQLLRFPANWKRYGRSAGMVRNGQMLNVADACFAFHDGESRGTAQMLRISRAKGIPTEVYYFANQLGVF